MIKDLSLKQLKLLHTIFKLFINKLNLDQPHKKKTEPEAVRPDSTMLEYEYLLWRILASEPMKKSRCF